MMNKPTEGSEISEEQDDVFASGRIVKPKVTKTPESDGDDEPDDDDDGWL